jgi:hypothetical protein
MSFFGLLEIGIRRRMLESWCVVEGGCPGLLLQAKGGREGMNEYK